MCCLFEKCKETPCLSGHVQWHVRWENIDFGGRQIFYLPLLPSSESYEHWRFNLLSNLPLYEEMGIDV